MGSPGHHQFLLGAKHLNCSQNEVSGHLCWLWIWSDSGCTMSIQQRTHSITQLNIILVATDIYSQLVQILTHGGCLSWVKTVGPTKMMKMRTWMKLSACLVTQEFLGFTHLWELTDSSCAQQDSRKQSTYDRLQLQTTTFEMF